MPAIPTLSLERILHTQGFGSRRACRQMIRDGRVRVGEAVIDNPLCELPPAELAFTVDGQHWRYRERAYVMLHKPPGFECSRAPRQHAGVLDLLPAQLRQRGV